MEMLDTKKPTPIQKQMLADSRKKATVPRNRIQAKNARQNGFSGLSDSLPKDLTICHGCGGYFPNAKFDQHRSACFKNLKQHF